ncbi:rhomboid-like protein 14, mitochondrial [Miscanthus floridulus]|uniref:rhomboid-like protein 14, mitochondrial n=1 Tax=Miscanthus floridulus TaxID=154761 RepID=UPI003458281B
MGSGMSSYRRRPRGFVLDPSKGMLPLLGLQVLLEYGRAGSARPPATAALLAANVLIFLRPGALDAILPKKAYVALNPNIFFKFRDLKTFFLSPWYHVNEVHLFCNMTTLLWTGVELETSMGTAEFASMVAALLGLSQGAMLLLSKGLSLLGEGAPYYEEFCIGFSGVLFGMKAVTMSARQGDFLHLAGMVIPAKYSVWAELFLVQALIPNTSFVGHLGGILAGHVYLWLKGSFNRNRPAPGSFNRLGSGSFNRPGPLSRLISCGTRAMALPVRFAQELVRSVLLLPKGHVTGRRRAGCCASAARGCPKGCWVCSSCNDYNSLATDICERCSTMREDCASSWGQHHQASCHRELTVEELRIRRVHRFDI